MLQDKYWIHFETVTFNFHVGLSAHWSLAPTCMWLPRKQDWCARKTKIMKKMKKMKKVGSSRPLESLTTRNRTKDTLISAFNATVRCSANWAMVSQKTCSGETHCSTCPQWQAMPRNTTWIQTWRSTLPSFATYCLVGILALCFRGDQLPVWALLCYLIDQ